MTIQKRIIFILVGIVVISLLASMFLLNSDKTKHGEDTDNEVDLSFWDNFISDNSPMSFNIFGAQYPKNEDVSISDLIKDVKFCFRNTNHNLYKWKSPL